MAMTNPEHVADDRCDSGKPLLIESISIFAARHLLRKFSTFHSLRRHFMDGLERWSNLGIVLPGSAASIASVVSLAAAGRVSIPLVTAAFLLVYSSYLIDHLADVGRFEKEMDSDRSRALSRHKHMLAVFGTGAFAGALAITAFSAPPTAMLLLLSFPLAVMFYGTTWFGKLTRHRFGYRRLKEIPGIKAFYTAFFWGLLTLYANCFVGGNELTVAIFFFGYLLALFFVNTVFCDFKDLYRDRIDGVDTLPLLLGVPATLQLLRRCNWVALLWLYGFALAGWIPPWLIGLTLTHAVLSAILASGEKALAADILPGEAAIDAAFLAWLPGTLIGLWLFPPVA
jgi:1,4-dihydroxy-2-naphthoate octaprenyltransferase